MSIIRKAHLGSRLSDINQLITFPANRRTCINVAIADQVTEDQRRFYSAFVELRHKPVECGDMRARNIDYPARYL